MHAISKFPSQTSVRAAVGSRLQNMFFKCSNPADLRRETWPEDTSMGRKLKGYLLTGFDATNNLSAEEEDIKVSTT